MLNEPGTSSNNHLPPKRSTQVIAKEKRALILKAEADVANGELALHLAESLPADDAKRTPNIAAAKKAIAAAKDALSIATANSVRTSSYAPLSLNILNKAQGGVAPGRMDHVVPKSIDGKGRGQSHLDSSLIIHRSYPPWWILVAMGLDRRTAVVGFSCIRMDAGSWDMKWLHRLMVTSETYRRVSHVGDATGNLAIDPKTNCFGG